jgi:hypothetical protein
MDTNMKRPTRSGPAPVLTSATAPQALALPLPFDDGVDEAIPFVLTAAAHREVLGRDAPPLAAVPRAGPRTVARAVANTEPGAGGTTDALRSDVAEATDTRRVQARALLRSGMPVGTIAAALAVDVAAVERWTSDLGDELARRRRRSAARRRATRQSPSTENAVRSASAASSDAQALVPGLALALAEFDAGGVSFVHHRSELVAILLAAVRKECDVPDGRLRVAVRLAPEVPADRIRTEVAEQLSVDPVSIIVGRARTDAVHPLELRVDVRDAAVAALVRAWCAASPEGEGTGLRGWDSNPQTFRLTADCSAN